MRLAQITCPLLTIHVIIHSINYKRGELYGKIHSIRQAVEKDAAGDQQKPSQKLGQH